MDAHSICQADRAHAPALVRIAPLLLALAVAGCAAAPPTIEVWARHDGQRAAEHAWIEADFRQSEAYCRFEGRKAMVGVETPYVDAGGGGQLSGAMTNLMNASAHGISPGMYNDCMGSRGYYLQSVKPL